VRRGNEVGTESKEPQRDDEKGTSWKSRTAAAVILGTFGLVVYVTVTTGSIPANVALPLLAAAAFGLWAFDIGDFTGRKK
jgi:Flp pilus assembly protein TadB